MIVRCICHFSVDERDHKFEENSAAFEFESPQTYEPVRINIVVIDSLEALFNQPFGQAFFS